MSTPFFSEDRREPDYSAIPVFDFGLVAPNQQGDIVEIRVKISEGVVRNLIPSMQAWLERINYGKGDGPRVDR